MGVLNVLGYYDGLAALLDHAVQEGFLRPQHREAMHAATTPGELLAAFDGWRPSRANKWLDRTGPPPAA
jgi:predicted Rossmann-fold nucleotide-binding protein